MLQRCWVLDEDSFKLHRILCLSSAIACFKSWVGKKCRQGKCQMQRDFLDSSVSTWFAICQGAPYRWSMLSLSSTQGLSDVKYGWTHAIRNVVYCLVVKSWERGNQQDCCAIGYCNWIGFDRVHKQACRVNFAERTVVRSYSGTLYYQGLYGKLWMI